MSLRIKPEQFYLHSVDKLEEEMQLSRKLFGTALKEENVNDSVIFMRYLKELNDEIERRRSKKSECPA